jgi:hypothetical protein
VLVVVVVVVDAVKIEDSEMDPERRISFSC